MRPTALRDWHDQGSITVAVSSGLESAPSALRGVFEGGNLGEQLVQIVQP
ncbi:hypothetical protein [Nocardia miyunensis]|nr:hypothetical protein [Nocardia miyunensis]